MYHENLKVCSVRSTRRTKEDSWLFHEEQRILRSRLFLQQTLSTGEAELSTIYRQKYIKTLQVSRQKLRQILQQNLKQIFDLHKKKQDLKKILSICFKY